MNDDNVLARAIEFAARKHVAQVDKCGEPYILHPIQVALRLPSFRQRIVAVLHDVIEDTDATLSDLADLGLSPSELEAVDALTKRADETRARNLDRIIACGELAISVKIADIQENSRPDRRHPDQESLGKAYAKALARLEAALASTPERAP